MASNMMILRVEDLDKLVSVSDASMLTGINVETIRRWLRQGRITCYGTRRCYRVHLAELLPVSRRKVVDDVEEDPVHPEGEIRASGTLGPSGCTNLSFH